MNFAYSILYVPDVEEAARFYETVFGFERSYVDPEGVYVGLKTGGTTLAFSKEDFVRGNGLRFAPVRQKADPPGIEIGFVVDDVEGCLKKALAAGATSWYEPALQPWGQTVAYVRDPNGFLVEIASPPPAQSNPDSD